TVPHTGPAGWVGPDVRVAEQQDATRCGAACKLMARNLDTTSFAVDVAPNPQSHGPQHRSGDSVARAKSSRRKLIPVPAEPPYRIRGSAEESPEGRSRR